MTLQMNRVIHGILTGDTCGDIISQMKWSDGVLTLAQHDREYEEFAIVRRGHILAPADVVAIQAYRQQADELQAAGFRVVDDIAEIANSVRSTPDPA